MSALALPAESQPGGRCNKMSELVKALAFPFSRATFLAARCYHPGPAQEIRHHWAWTTSRCGKKSLRDSSETFLFTQVRSIFTSFSGLTFSWREVTIKSSLTAKSETRSHWQLVPQEEAKRKGPDIYRMDAGFVNKPRRPRRSCGAAGSPNPSKMQALPRHTLRRRARLMEPAGASSFTEDSGAAFSTHTFMAEWLNLESVSSKARLCSHFQFKIKPNHVYLASHESRLGR